MIKPSEAPKPLSLVNLRQIIEQEKVKHSLERSNNRKHSEEIEEGEIVDSNNEVVEISEQRNNNSNRQMLRQERSQKERKDDEFE